MLPIIQKLTEAALKIAEAFGKDGAAGGIKELQSSLVELGTGSDGMINTFGKIYNAIAGFVNGVQAALAIPMAAIHFLRTGDLGNYTIKKIPSFAEMTAAQGASPGFTSARQFESAMPSPISTGTGGGGDSFTMPTKVPKSVTEPPMLRYKSEGDTSGGVLMGGLPNITINAGLVSSPASIGQDIIDAILQAQRDSGVVFQPATGL